MPGLQIFLAFDFSYKHAYASDIFRYTNVTHEKHVHDDNDSSLTWTEEYHSLT